MTAHPASALVKFWSHPVCDRAPRANKCRACRLWADGNRFSAIREAARTEAREEQQP